MLIAWRVAEGEGEHEACQETEEEEEEGATVLDVTSSSFHGRSQVYGH